MHTIRKLFAACAAALLLFAGGLASAAERNISITSWDDLRSAVANASAGDTLNVSCPIGYNYLSIDGKPTITISKSLTIRSADPSNPIKVRRTSVVGHGAFVVTAWAVKIQGFEFTGSDKTNDVEYEGCIRSTTGELTLKDCSFLYWDGDYRYTSEADETMAGAVTARGTKLTLDGCTFGGCSIVNYTDMVGNRIQCAGAVSSFCHDTIVRNCSFVSNVAVDTDHSSGIWIQTGGLYVDGGDKTGNVMIADSTFAKNEGIGLYTWINTSILGTTFVYNNGPAFMFRPLTADKRLRMANALLLGNRSDYEFSAYSANHYYQILMTHTVFGSCPSTVARQNCYCAGTDNWQQWFLNVADGVPKSFATKVNGIDRYAYPLSAYAYGENRNVAAPLLYDGNYANPTVNKGLSMKSNPTVLWYGDTVGTSTLHTQGVDGKDCYDEYEDEYHFSCGSAMSCPVSFKFTKRGTKVATRTVMWNYGSITMPTVGAIDEGYNFLGWDGLYREGQTVWISQLLENAVYISGENEMSAVIQPITYTIEYRGFNAAFDAEYHRQTDVRYSWGWIKEWTGGGDVPVYGGLLNCTNEAANVEAYDYACQGYTCKGWATSKARAQAGLVDYEFGQMLGSDRDGVDLTTTDGATVTLWLVRSPNQGYVRFYSDSYKTNWVDYPAVTRQAFTVPECPFIPEPGYRFKNWSLGYEQPFKNPGDVIYVTVPAPGAVAVAGSYVADWETSYGYTIHYHANGGVGGEFEQSIGMQYALQPQVLLTAQEAGAVSREGYTFMGWSKTEGANNTVDYLPGRSAWGLTKDDTLDLYAVWKITDGSTHVWTAKEIVAGTSMDITYVWQVIDATAKSCRLTRVIGGTAITGNWSLRDFVRDESGNVWYIVEYANTIVGDLANIPEIEIGGHVTNGAECLRYDNGKGIRQKIKGTSYGFDPNSSGYFSEDIVYFCSDDGLLFKYQDDGTYHLAAVPCTWNNADRTGLLDIPAILTIDFLGDVGYYTVSGIASDACSALKNINTVVIPQSITSIANDAFANNYGASPFVAGDGGISQVYFDADEFDLSMKDWSVAFKETDWNATVCQPVIRYSDNVVIGYIPCEALEDNTCTVVVPEGVPAIANNAFEGCAQMASVTLPSTLEAIGESAFSSCVSLTGVDIPAAVTNVADYAFDGCTSLASLTGGAGLLGVDFSVGVGIISNTKLQQDADASTSAEGAYVTIGAGIGEGDSILVYHGALDENPLNLLPGIVGIAGGAVYNDSALYTAEIPDTVRWVGAYAFDYCPNLTKIRLCVTTKTSPDFARLDRNAQSQGCEIEIYGSAACDTINSTFRVSLGQDVVGGGGEVPLKLVIGSGIRKITGSAFVHSAAEDMQIKSVTGGNDLVSVSRAAFAGTTWATTEASLEPGVVATGYPHRNIGSFYVGYFGESASMLTMPEIDEVTGDYITRLSPTAFDGCSLTELTLASQLDAGQLTPDVFADQMTLNALIIDPSAPNYTTDEGVLYDKEKTSLLVYPREKSGDFTLPATVTSISEGACQGAKIYSLTIPAESALTTIPAHTFEYSSITSVTFGDRVAVIGAYAFCSCNQLESVTFGSGLSRVEDGAFQLCRLQSVEFPRTLESIGALAFDNCSYMDSVTFRGNAPACDATAFSYVCDGAKAYVYPESKGWNGDPTSSELPVSGLWNGLAIEKLQDNFANWADYNGLSGEDAAYDAKPAKWGGKYENAFVFLFGEDIVNGTKQLISIDFFDGVPRITTPKEISRDDDDFPYVVTVAGTTDVTDWAYSHCVYLTTNPPGEPDPSKEPPEGYTYWWLNEGDAANFFRIKLR